MPSTICNLHILIDFFNTLSVYSSQVIQQIKMHGKIKAQGSYLLNAKRVSTRVQKNQNQQSLFEMMYVFF